jgi:hypothetical protein
MRARWTAFVHRTCRARGPGLYPPVRGDVPSGDQPTQDERSAVRPIHQRTLPTLSMSQAKVGKALLCGSYPSPQAAADLAETSDKTITLDHCVRSTLGFNYPQIGFGYCPS